MPPAVATPGNVPAGGGGGSRTSWGWIQPQPSLAWTHQEVPGAGCEGQAPCPPPSSAPHRRFVRGDSFGERMSPPNPAGSPGRRQAAPALLPPAWNGPGDTRGCRWVRDHQGGGSPKRSPHLHSVSPAPTSATEEKEEGQAGFWGVAPRAPLLCPSTSCHGQEARAGARGGAGRCLAARRRLPASPPQNPCQGRPGRLLPLPTEAGGRTRGRS